MKRKLTKLPLSELKRMFWQKVNKQGPVPTCNPRLGRCWEWTAALGSKGYGAYNNPYPTPSHAAGAHRLSYAWSNGKIPTHLQIDHLCRNRICVRPSHLEAVTSRENLMRGNTRAAANVLKTNCPKGHLYDNANTAIDSGGSRICRECRKERCRRWRIATGYSITQWRHDTGWSR